MISLPKGVNARVTILKCCFPKGIPMIVMHNTTPQKRWLSAIQIPPRKIHNKFNTVLRQPVPDSTVLVVFTKGQSAKAASLKL